MQALFSVESAGAHADDRRLHRGARRVPRGQALSEPVTKWRAEADARRSDAARSAVAARMTDAFATASRTIGKDSKVMA
jgi:hypothetical protein